MKFRRLIVNLFGCVCRNKPSGIVAFFMSSFIVVYLIITRLDKADRNHRNGDVFDVRKHFPSHLQRTHESVQQEARREELALDNTAKMNKNVDYYEQAEYNVIIQTEANELNREKETYNKSTVEQHQSDDSDKHQIIENERFLQEKLNEDEEEIENKWNNYLGSNNSSSKLNKALTSHKQLHKSQMNDHLQFQGIFQHNNNQEIHHTYKISKYINIYEATKETAETKNSISANACVLLKTLHGDSPICIHNPDDDEIISAQISSQGTWEPNYVYAVGSVLHLNPDFMFLDLGCNLGVYTILAAKLGHMVIAIDPNKANLRLLTKSLSLGNLLSKVTLIWNAISDVNEHMILSDIVGNKGGSFVHPAANDSADSTEQLVAITLDDLTEQFRDKRVFIKMDIETYEWKALKGGETFFKEVDVRYVLMEWLYHKQNESGKDIVKFMSRFGFYPHVNAHYNTRLEIKNYKSWPGNVLWIKY